MFSIFHFIFVYGKFTDSENITQAKEMMKQEVMREYYHKNYNWQPIAYDSYKAWTYLFGRCTKEYAAIMQVFNEIVKRDPDFKPQSFFDFGAGVGTGTWAASELWKKSLYEYFLVDECGDMNDLSELILRGGNEDKNMSLKNVFYRQFLPASDEVKQFKNFALLISSRFVSLFISVQISFDIERFYIE